MPIIDAYGERKAMKVRQDTWGHLAPKPGRTYRGTVLIAVSEYSGQGTCIIRDTFEDLASPWFYDHLCEFVGDLEDLEDGQIYLWTGTYRFFKGRRRNGRTPYLDEGYYRFEGAIARLDI